MTVEFASDRKALLADFGEVVIFQAPNVGSKSVKGIFDNLYQDVDAGMTVGISMQQPRLFCATSDIVGIREGATMKRGSTNYVVRVVMDDGTGMTELMLERQ
jgi:hypothetical protein